MVEQDGSEAQELLWEDFLYSYNDRQIRLEHDGFSKNAVALAGAASHLGYWKAEKILHNNPTELGVAFLIAHYCNVYTPDDGQIDWVEPEEVREQRLKNDIVRNALDYQLKKKEFDYSGLNRSGIGHYRDEFGFATTTFQAELGLCKQIETYLTARINAGRTRLSIDPRALPRYVDMKLRAEIVNGLSSRKT